MVPNGFVRQELLVNPSDRVGASPTPRFYNVHKPMYLLHHPQSSLPQGLYAKERAVARSLGKNLG